MDRFGITILMFTDFSLFVNWYKTFEDLLNHLEGMHLFEDAQDALEQYRVELFRENGQYEEYHFVLRKLEHPMVGLCRRTGALGCPIYLHTVGVIGASLACCV